MLRLENRRVVFTGTRKVQEVATIVQKLGGVLVERPTLKLVVSGEEALNKQLEELLAFQPDLVTFTTGGGTEIMMKTAERLGKVDELLGCFRCARIAARGYKTVNFLKTIGIVPTVRDDDGTIEGLIRALEPIDISGSRVAVQLYDDGPSVLMDRFRAWGCTVLSVLPYTPTCDIDQIDALLREIIAEKVDAVAFSSAGQVKALLDRARERGDCFPQLQNAFQTHVIACAVGKVTYSALQDGGIHRVVTPTEGRIGSMVIALAKYYETERP